jgi:hypothetical protein
VNLIGSVSTAEGLKVRAELDENMYDAGIKVSDATNSTASGTTASSLDHLVAKSNCSSYFC